MEQQLYASYAISIAAMFVVVGLLQYDHAKKYTFPRDVEIDIQVLCMMASIKG